MGYSKKLALALAGSLLSSAHAAVPCESSATPCVIYQDELVVSDAGDPRFVTAEVPNSCDSCYQEEAEFIIRKLTTSSQVASSTVPIVGTEATWSGTLPKAGLYTVEVRQCWRYAPPAANTSTECNAQDPLRCCSDWLYSTDNQPNMPTGWVWLQVVPTPTGGGIE